MSDRTKFRQKVNASDYIEYGIEEVLAEGRTKFQDFLIFRSKVHGVCIVLDGDMQSCERDEAIYHEALVHPAMFLSDDPKKVLIMGGGEGATAREVLKHPTVEKVVMVDIDKHFVDLCKEYVPSWGAGAFADPRLEVHYRDIKAYLLDTDEKFDVVIGDLVDVADWDSPVARLYGKEFYSTLVSVMRDKSFLATQGGCLGATDCAGHANIRARLSINFAEVESYGIAIPGFYSLWGFVIASTDKAGIAGIDKAPLFKDMAKERNVKLPGAGPVGLGSSFCIPASVQKAWGG